ncbi:MAG TPA: ADP-ribose pyrophosphatase, partial [Deltaproteobacteria bacterium]|nr:ADP-ribose pyrophosphatase [Deltaproteobacteria bacterium]
LGLAGTIREFVGMYSFTLRNQLLLVYHVEASGEVALGAELQEIRRVAPERVRPWPYGTGPAVSDWLLRRGITPRES